MANYRAVATGNWNSGATWGGGAVPPDAAGHNIYSNGFTVTIDTNINVAILTNAAITASFVGGGTSAAVGGGFVLNDGITINATSINAPASTSVTTPTILYSGSTSATITASIAINAGIGAGGALGSVSQHTIRHAGTGTLTITGNCNGQGSSGQAGHAVYLSGTGTINITGNLLGGSGTVGIDSLGGTAVVNKSSGSGIINVTGNVTGAGSGNHGLANISSGIVNVFGNVTSTGAGNGILQNASGCTLSVNGNVTASSSAHGVNATAGAVTVTTGSFTSTNGFNAVVGAGTVTASGSFIYSANGTLPISAPRIVLGTSPLVARTRYSLNGAGTYVDMFTADNSLGQANPTDVRSGVSYASGTLTGRLTVPARGSVALSVAYGPSMPFTATRSGTTATATLAYSYPLVVGDQITVTGASNSEWNSTYTIASIVSGTSVTFEVPASHSSTAGTGANMQTTGTAALDPASIEAAVQSALTAQGLTTARAGNLDNLDATVSSRLAPSGTLATVTTLTNAPASVTASDIWSYATRTITGGTVDTLTNAPSVPSAATIASQVRTELSVELARIDAATSTRATPANIPTSDITAIKAKTDALNTTRLAQVSTTEIVGNLLAQANS